MVVSRALLQKQSLCPCHRSVLIKVRSILLLQKCKYIFSFSTEHNNIKKSLIFWLGPNICEWNVGRQNLYFDICQKQEKNNKERNKMLIKIKENTWDNIWSWWRMFSMTTLSTPLPSPCRTKSICVSMFLLKSSWSLQDSKDHQLVN